MQYRGLEGGVGKGREKVVMTIGQGRYVKILWNILGKIFFFLELQKYLNGFCIFDKIQCIGGRSIFFAFCSQGKSRQTNSKPHAHVVANAAIT
jgi:hypothetical protein